MDGRHNFLSYIFYEYFSASEILFVLSYQVYTF